MLREIDILHDLSSSGWSADLEKYHLNEEQLEELLCIYSYHQNPRRDEFCSSINNSVGKFCHGVRQYNIQKRCMDGNQKQKITMRLRGLSKDISKKSEALINTLAPITNQELEWILGDQFDDSTQMVHTYDQLYHLLCAFQRYAEIANIRVGTSTPSYIRQLTKECLNIVEHYTGSAIKLKQDEAIGEDYEAFSDFMVTLWYHIPSKIKNASPQKIKNFNSVIQEAIAENKRLVETEGL